MSSSRLKIYDNFADFFLKTESENKQVIVHKCTGLQWIREVKVDPVFQNGGAF